MQNFSGKVAAITGAGSGMGRALALSLADRGCHLAISDVDQTALAETATKITGVKISQHVLDVSQQHAVDQFALDVEAEHGSVNMIFNNAGVALMDRADRMSFENFRWLMDINFWGVVYGTRAFLPLLEKVDEAHIINTSSIFGVIAVPSQSAYNASKFAVRGYTYALRQELADSNIGVSCVQPGGVKTNIVVNSRYVPEGNESETKDEMATKFESLARLTPLEAAEQILKGVRKNKAQILVGTDAKVMALLERLMPTGYQKLLAKLLTSD